jgi:hypothetical protein
LPHYILCAGKTAGPCKIGNGQSMLSAAEQLLNIRAHNYYGDSALPFYPEDVHRIYTIDNKLTVVISLSDNIKDLV